MIFMIFGIFKLAFGFTPVSDCLVIRTQQLFCKYYANLAQNCMLLICDAVAIY